MSPRAEPRVSDRPRVSRWPLRAAALVIALLGLVPMANLLPAGSGAGLPWWSQAVRQWLMWSGVISAIAIGFGFVFTEQIEEAHARGTQLLLAPSRRTFT